MFDVAGVLGICFLELFKIEVSSQHVTTSCWYRFCLIAGQIITICCWTDILSVETKFQLCMVGHNTKVSGISKIDLTFTNVDLTNVRCQTVIIGPGLN